MSSDYQPEQLEQQIQHFWEAQGCFHQDEDTARPKYYALAMFPYPSGKLHIGHARVYTITDLLARYHRMLGQQVLHPIGWDAFGLPAENAAIDKGIHPAKWTNSNIVHMRNQLKRLGCCYDWRREFATCDPSYYKWEQWLFIQMFKRGLAYRKESWVNWDPVDTTVLANEQVENGRGWRSGALVERKKLWQWNIRITAYADELLDGLGKLDWPQNIIAMQANWIGRSSGAHIDFTLDAGISPGAGGSLRVFTTRPDTLMGASCIAIAADHPLMDELCATRPELASFAASCRLPREHHQEQPKKGLPTGLYAVHPLSGEQLQIWVANFVLMEYGTGAVMSVPAHDQRDWEFATTCDLPIRQVIAPLDGECDISTGAYTGYGVCIHSGKYNGLDFTAASHAIVADLAAKGLGEAATTYRLRDWGVSRQRYWGTPIPIIHCQKCGEVPVPESDLPVSLPEDIQLTGRGSPLADNLQFVEVACPICGAPARRDTDTLDTFFESSWYQSRFASYDCTTAMLDWRARHWCPVDQYVGGIEHAILHLLYARFFHRVMRDCLHDERGQPLLTSDEPFTSLLAQGMVLAPVYKRQDGERSHYANALDLQLAIDGQQHYGIHRTSGRRYEFDGVGKMSKSRANGVDPDRVIDQYGADTLRLYLLFAAPPEQSLEWSERGVVGMSRYLNRLWSLCLGYTRPANPPDAGSFAQPAAELWRKAHQSIAKVRDDIARRRTFNTAIAAIMELTNTLQRLDAGANYALGRQVAEYLVQMLAPFVPHICEALWVRMGHPQGQLLDLPYPQPDLQASQADEITLVVQINGKLRARISVPLDADRQQLQNLAIGLPQVQSHLKGAVPRNVIVVPNKLVNLVV